MEELESSWGTPSKVFQYIELLGLGFGGTGNGREGRWRTVPSVTVNIAENSMPLFEVYNSACHQRLQEGAVPIVIVA
jgi:hypothetical protein